MDVASKLAQLRAVVHCAGRGATVQMVEHDGQPGSLELFETILRVNVIGTYNVLRLAAARCRTADSRASWNARRPSRSAPRLKAPP